MINRLDLGYNVSIAMNPSSSRATQIASKAKWPLFLVANLAILFVVGVSTVRETYRGWTVDREIEQLETKARQLEGRRSELAELAIKMNTPAYVEREARAKLGLQKPGERVIILEGVSATQTVWSVDITTPPQVAVDLRTNPQRWWDYFTHADTGSDE